MSGFAEWSRRAATSPAIWSKPNWPPASMSIMLAPLKVARYPISIEVGEPEADIDLDHAAIRHPDPFDGDHLTVECRRYLYDAACAAVDHDHRLRWVVWADRSLTSCNPIRGRRRSPRFG
jgi:hypothetical protein